MSAVVLDRFVPANKTGWRDGEHGIGASHPAVAGLLDGETVYDSRYISYEGEWSGAGDALCKFSGAWRLKCPDPDVFVHDEPVLCGVDSFLVYFHDTGKIYQFYPVTNTGYRRY